MSRYASARHSAFSRQHGRCYYCDQPMWLTDSDGFAMRHDLTRAQARWLQATAEHLTARQDGGGNGLNIVAACLRCNSTRHARRPHCAPDPARYRARVQTRMAQGRWHPFRLSGDPAAASRLAPSRSYNG